VTDGIEDAQPEPGYRHRALINAVRHILWITHDDKETTLEDSDYSQKAEQSKAANAYRKSGTNHISYGPCNEGSTTDIVLEVAHEKAEVYSNYDDNGKPVDRIIDYKPTGMRLFGLQIVAQKPYLPKGAYDGKYNSIGNLLRRARG
ncbi:MAG: hypothetical protein NT033_10515, partial [Candidatus Omnitrophica bacterium]|nr:hypothetical protein [Candidatus Omnitrophota bacterium]